MSSGFSRSLERSKQHHAAQDKTWSGQFTWKQRKRIKDVIDRFECQSILDFGCGKGKQYGLKTLRPGEDENRDETGRTLEQYWGMGATKYDPAVPRFEAEPRGKFDLVICVQVLIQIACDGLPSVVDRLYHHAAKAIFVAERIGRPRKTVHDDMATEMPYHFEVNDWMKLLRRPGNQIRLVAVFHKPDEWTGWRIEEPEDQGPKL